MFTIRKKIRFEAAHRLVSSWSKPCQRLHGHSYIMEIFLKGNTLNQDGMILDFGALKEIIKELIDSVDHRTILSSKDELCKVLPEEIVNVPYNPTAEEMSRDFAIYFMSRLCDLDILEIIVRLHETETGWAEFSITKEEYFKLTEEKKK